MNNKPSLSQKSPNAFTPALVSLLVLIVSLTATYFFNKAETNETDQNFETYFDFRVREASSVISNRIDTYAEVLRAASGLFYSSDLVNREEFKRFVTSLALGAYYPGIQGVGFSYIIAPQDLEPHIASIRNEGFPTYSVYPEGERDIYTSIIYLEPFSDRNLRAFGYDMYSESTRQTAMNRAAENNNLSLSGAVRLVQESGVDDQAGFLMYMPVYKPNQPIRNVSERQENLMGWAYSVFRMNDFMQGAQGEFSNDLHIKIYDGEIISESNLMYDSLAVNSTFQENPDSTLQQDIRLTVVDHVWTIRINSLPSMALRVDVNNAAYVTSIGIISSISLTLIIWLLLSGRQRAITISRSMHKELIYEQERLQNIIAGTRIGTWEWNVQTGETTFNEYWAAILGYTLSELSPISIETWGKLVHPDDLKKSDTLLQTHFSGEMPYYECEVRMRHKDGHWVWVLDRGKVTSRTDDGKPLLMFGTHEDISSRKETEASLLYDLQHDILTKLPNRALLLERLQRGLLNAKRHSSKLAVMFIDLDKFKLINDTLGHDVGDQVLIRVARIIESCLRESDTVSRIGGDEFFVFLPIIESTADVELVAEKIRQTVGENFMLNGEALDVSSSIGIAIYPEHGTDVDTLMKNADTAMYYAKHCGRNNVKLYQEGLMSSNGK